MFFLDYGESQVIHLLERTPRFSQPEQETLRQVKTADRGLGCNRLFVDVCSPMYIVTISTWFSIDPLAYIRDRTTDPVSCWRLL